MSGKEQEPVIEQSDDSKESTVSVPVEEAPIASTKTEETLQDVPANDIKEELNYLSSKIFSKVSYKLFRSPPSQRYPVFP